MWLALLWSLLTACVAAPPAEVHQVSRRYVPGGGGGECAEVNLRCAYRTGCGAALNNYMVWCADVLRGESRCPEQCQHALIALTSTEEGKNLMNCECNDDYCQETKQRIEVCKPQVLKANLNETVTCRLSYLICDADALCSKALEYYRRNCRSMFMGKKCSRRCLNSIDILRRQEKAAKLSNCRCDGLENFDCFKVQSNMERLCFHKTTTKIEVETTTVREDLRTNETSAGVRIQSSIALIIILTSLIKWTTPT